MSRMVDTNRLVDTTTARLGVLGSLLALTILVIAGGGYFLINSINVSQREVVERVDDIHRDMTDVRAELARNTDHSDERFERMMTVLEELVAATVAGCWASANGEESSQSWCRQLGEIGGRRD